MNNNDLISLCAGSRRVSMAERIANMDADLRAAVLGEAQSRIAELEAEVAELRHMLAAVAKSKPGRKAVKE